MSVPTPQTVRVQRMEPASLTSMPPITTPPGAQYGARVITALLPPSL